MLDSGHRDRWRELCEVYHLLLEWNQLSAEVVWAIALRELARLQLNPWYRPF